MTALALTDIREEQGRMKDSRTLRHRPHRWAHLLQRRTGARRSCDDGSACTELVVLTPLLVAIIGGYFFAGRLVLTRQDVDDAARTAVQAAVTAPDAHAAQWLAGVTSYIVLAPDHGVCSNAAVKTDTSDFFAGGNVFVSVTCVAQFSSVAFAGVPGSVTLTATRGAVLEPYREIGR
jgi:Flp pilus assembly protein TadG